MNINHTPINHFIEDNIVYYYDIETGEIVNAEEIEPSNKCVEYFPQTDIPVELGYIVGRDAIGLLKKMILNIDSNNIVKMRLSEVNKDNRFPITNPVLEKRRLSDAKKALISNKIITQIDTKTFIISPLIGWKGDFALRKEFIKNEISSAIRRSSTI